MIDIREKTTCFRCGEQYTKHQFIELEPNLALTYVYSLATNTIIPDHSMDMRHCAKCGAPVSMIVQWSKTPPQENTQPQAH